MSLVPYVHLDTSLASGGRGTEIALSPEDLHHLTRVLRLRDDAELVVADGLGWVADAVLTTSGVRLVDDPRAQERHAPQLVVVQAVPKGRKLDEVVRQVVELGVERVIPVDARRSVAQRDPARAHRAVERWTAIARAAAEQSRQPWRPTVEQVTTLADAVASLPGDGLLLLADPGAPPLLDVVARCTTTPRTVAVFVGPEGGWSDDERARLADLGVQPAGLGPSVLRTEHAAAAAVAVLAASLGRWR